MAQRAAPDPEFLLLMQIQTRLLIGFDADPGPDSQTDVDPGSQSDVDPDPTFKNDTDPCESGFATLL